MQCRRGAREKLRSLGELCTGRVFRNRPRGGGGFSGLVLVFNPLPPALKRNKPAQLCMGRLRLWKAVCSEGAIKSLLPSKGGVPSPYAVGGRGRVRPKADLALRTSVPLVRSRLGWRAILQVSPAPRGRVRPLPHCHLRPPAGPTPPNERCLLASPSGGWRRPARGYDQPER